MTIEKTRTKGPLMDGDERDQKALPVRPIRWNREWPLRGVEPAEYYQGVEEYDPVLAAHLQVLNRR